MAPETGQLCLDRNLIVISVLSGGEKKEPSFSYFPKSSNSADGKRRMVGLETLLRLPSWHRYQSSFRCRPANPWSCRRLFLTAPRLLSNSGHRRLKKRRPRWEGADPGVGVGSNARGPPLSHATATNMPRSKSKFLDKFTTIQRAGGSSKPRTTASPLTVTAKKSSAACSASSGRSNLTTPTGERSESTLRGRPNRSSKCLSPASVPQNSASGEIFGDASRGRRSCSPDSEGYFLKLFL